TKAEGAARTPQADVYKQMITDLKEARDLLTSQYVDASAMKTTGERTRPNKWAATALLARVYLYTKDYAKAEAIAGDVVGNTPTYQINRLYNAFLKYNA